MDIEQFRNDANNDLDRIAAPMERLQISTDWATQKIDQKLEDVGQIAGNLPGYVRIARRNKRLIFVCKEKINLSNYRLLRRQKFTFNNMNPHWGRDEIRYGARVVAAVDRTRLQDDKNGFTIGIVSLCFVFQVEYNVFNFILFFSFATKKCRANFAKIQPILCYLSKIRQAGVKLLIEIRAMKSSKVCLFVYMVGWRWLLYWINSKIWVIEGQH